MKEMNKQNKDKIKESNESRNHYNRLISITESQCPRCNQIVGYCDPVYMMCQQCLRKTGVYAKYLD